MHAGVTAAVAEVFLLSLLWRIHCRLCWSYTWLQAQELYTLLHENYVEDGDQMFRFDYSVPFLKCARVSHGTDVVLSCSAQRDPLACCAGGRATRQVPAKNGWWACASCRCGRVADPS